MVQKKSKGGRKFLKLKINKPKEEKIFMDSISLKVPVTVKAILTEELRDRILSNIEKNLNRAELELKQLDVDEKRNLEEQGSTPQAEASIRRFFSQEKQKRLNFQAQENHRREEIHRLAIGAEINQGTLERQVELKVGDDMNEILHVEVVVKDDKVIAIRG